MLDGDGSGSTTSNTHSLQMMALVDTPLVFCCLPQRSSESHRMRLLVVASPHWSKEMEKVAEKRTPGYLKISIC